MTIVYVKIPLAPAPATAEALDHTPMVFGKYKGKTPDQISDISPSWLVWAFENVKDRPVCSRVLYRACQEEVRANKYEDPND